ADARERTPAGAPATTTAAAGRAAWLAAGAFLALALLQNQDVVLANALLDGDEAGRFAVLSTLGGIAAFASTTVPLVLLPRAQAGERGALAAAVGAAAALGAAAVLAVAVMPSDLVGSAFGERYAGVGALAVPYVAAMALFGVARVLVAHRCATAPSARALAAPVAILALHALAIVALGDSAAAIATITLVAMAALVASTAGGVLLRLPPAGRRGAEAQPAPAGAPPAPRRRPSRTALAVGALTLVALAVRAAANRGIWLDEATSISQAQLPFGAMLDQLRTLDVHPPLHHALLWALAHTLGTDEPVMRAPSYVAGAALVPVLYLAATELWDRRAGLAAAALGTLAPFLVWYAQEARMYALLMLFATLAVLGQLRALRTTAARDWALYAAASAALLWTQYFGILVVAVQQGAFLLMALRGERRIVKGWLLSTLALAVAVAPLLPFALDQFQANEASGRGFDQPSQAGADVSDTRSQPGVYIALTNVVWALWGYHSNGTMAAITSLWPLGLLAALLLLGRGRSPRTMIVVACAALPAAALYVVGEVKPFLFEIRYFAALAPLAVLLIARAATAWTRGALAAALATGVVLVSFGAAYGDQQINNANPRVYDFEGAFAQLEQEVRPGDVVLYEPKYLSEVVRYYAPDLPARPLEDGLDGIGRRGRVFLVGSFLEQPRHRDAIAAALDRLRRTRELDGSSFQRPQVKVWVLR
ncbi:MAG TPA: glycosyltransferase family 39 protein, partial [Capillimicrobium sp.]|nr:glycosyltransferase family 39 protein [Capillimicrobium sp.]